ncbi:MAG: hypothetical protein KC910_01760 [Candidatus Eremiobacteraeota bacterium]|nr:hypothetical protein [Candidatus Eremiobacteraeota bacterium]
MRIRPVVHTAISRRQSPAPVARDRLATASHVLEGVADGVNRAAGMAGLGLAGLFAGGLLSGALMSALGATSATASIPVAIATGTAVIGTAVGGGLLGMKVGSFLSNKTGALAGLGSQKLGFEPHWGRTLAKTALATGVMVAGGELILRGSAVAGAVLLAGAAAKWAWHINAS